MMVVDLRPLRSVIDAVLKRRYVSLISVRGRWGCFDEGFRVILIFNVGRSCFGIARSTMLRLLDAVEI